MMGLPLNFCKVLRAFSRGRRTKNLYSDFITTEQVLNMKIGDLQTHRNLDKINAVTKP